jgi:hypothetical protein
VLKHPTDGISSESCQRLARHLHLHKTEPLAQRAWTWRPCSTWGQCISSSVGCGDCVFCTSLATEQLDFLLRAIWLCGAPLRLIVDWFSRTGSCLWSFISTPVAGASRVGTDLLQSWQWTAIQHTHLQPIFYSLLFSLQWLQFSSGHQLHRSSQQLLYLQWLRTARARLIRHEGLTALLRSLMLLLWTLTSQRMMIIYA